MRQIALRGGSILITLLTSFDHAQAAGYALRTQSATAQGNAFAGATAAADDTSYLFFNPATLGFLQGWRLETSATWLAPQDRLTSSSASGVLGNTVEGRTRKADVGADGLAPALYVMAPLGDLRLGLAVTSPYALSSSYPNDWVGRYHAVDSEISSLNVTPTVAWRAAPWLSVGAGLQAQYLKGRLTNAIDYGTIGAGADVPGAVPGGQDGFARLDGDDWSYGWQVGAIVEPRDGTRLGVAYRSSVEHRLQGDAEFADDDAGVAAALRASSGMFGDTRSSLDVETPATLSFGLAQEVGAGVTLLADAVWTEWSSNRRLRAELAEPMADSVTEQRWNDTWFFSLGASWRPRPDLVLRTGIAWDQSPITDKYRTPRLPDNDRYWWSLGLGWQPLNWLSLDAAYTRQWVDDTDVELAASDPGNAARGNLSAEYEAHIDLFGVSASITF